MKNLENLNDEKFTKIDDKGMLTLAAGGTLPKQQCVDYNMTKDTSGSGVHGDGMYIIND